MKVSSWTERCKKWIYNHFYKQFKGVRVSDQFHFSSELIFELTLSTVGSTRALFFRGGCVGSPPELVPSPAPGAAQRNKTYIEMHKHKLLY